MSHAAGGGGGNAMTPREWANVAITTYRRSPDFDRDNLVRAIEQSITAALAEAAAEHAKVLKAAVEAERADCAAIAQKFGDLEIRDAILDRGKP